MSIKTIVSNSRTDVASLLMSYPAWVNPSVKYHHRDWIMLRDTFYGEREVKARGVEYLPKASGMDDDQYTLYKENATYFNMVARTVGALVGTIFRRNPKVSNLPVRLNDKIKNISKDNLSLRQFTLFVTNEVIHMGRVGVLVDKGPDGGKDPYFAMYITESILDWTVEQIDGKDVLTQVVLLEVVERDETPLYSGKEYISKYRVLRLVNGVYEQHIYSPKPDGSAPDIYADPDEVVRPTNRGTPFNEIPFYFFGSMSNRPDIERSPILDICRMNLSHYRSYAQLEHGRYYTGNPIFWVSKGEGEGAGEYFIGPSMVWEVGPGQKAGLMEFNGNGLKFLENAIAGKESHVATLGGRLIGIEARSTSESDNQVKMKNRNEHAVLLTATIGLDEGFSRALQFWARWADTPANIAKDISIEFNKDFLLKEVAAREFRAIQQMYQDGVIPIEVVFDYLQRAEVIPDWLDIDQFKRLLESEASFPNVADKEAWDAGFPDKKTELELEESEADRSSAERIAERNRQNAERVQNQSGETEIVDQNNQNTT